MFHSSIQLDVPSWQSRVDLPKSPSPRSPLDVASLSADQLECLCLVLENCANFHGLERLLTLAEADGLLQPNANGLDLDANQVLLRAKAVLLLHQGRFEEFKQHVRNNQFAQRDHGHLQMLWNEAHYAEMEKHRGKRLDPVSRYRVRKKNGFPSTIWDGESTSYCFKKSAREILRQAYQQQPVPSQQQKVELARQTQLSVPQVCNWFKNQRQRARQYQSQHQLESGRRFSTITADSEEEDCATDGAESEEQGSSNNGRDFHGNRPRKRRISNHLPGGGTGRAAAFGWEDAVAQGRQPKEQRLAVDLAKNDGGNVYLGHRLD